MKRIYSIILLLAFFVGIMQPIMPMIEYQLYSGNIINLLTSNPDYPCDGPLLIMEAACREEQNTAQDLLDDSYYPLALQMTAPPELRAFPLEKKLSFNLEPHIHNLSYTPTPPPPRLS